jgi:regulatory protein
VATVTALRSRRDRIAVELDGVPWRTLPVQAVAEAGLGVGLPLDRERARALARALRRTRATDVALRALTHRDRSRSALDGRLARAGVRAAERQETLDRAVEAGLVDDARYARSRAIALAERGAGDLFVLDDLERHGVASELARDAVSELEPEVSRAARIVAARGSSQRTLRHLAARGFTRESVEGLIAEIEDGTLR